MKALLLVILLLLLFPVVVTSLLARDREGDTIWSGDIRELRDAKCQSCDCAMVYAVLNTDDGRVEVKLAPKSYFAGNGMTLAVGNKVEVAGFKDKENGKEVIVALRIRRGGETLLMRSRIGQTMWESAANHACLCER